MGAESPKVARMAQYEVGESLISTLPRDVPLLLLGLGKNMHARGIPSLSIAVRGWPPTPFGKLDIQIFAL